MSRFSLILNSKKSREQALHWIAQAPDGMRIEFKKPKRTIEQNDLMWARLTQLSVQLIWHGRRYSPDDWKDYMMHALRKGRWMPDEDGGQVPVGLSTSDLSKEEFSDLLDLIDAFAARHGVRFDEPEAA